MKKMIDNIDKIKTENLIQYLYHINWHKVCDIPGYGSQFASSDEVYSAIILTNKEVSDYNEVLLDALKSISEFSNISLESLLLILLYPAYDKIKWRIPSLNNNIPFLVLPELLKSIKDTFTVAIKDIQTPAIFHKSLKTTKDINKLFNDMQFGQTEIGSYIVNVLSPLGNFQWDLFENLIETPIARKVNEKVLLSISKISNDIELQNKNKIEEEIEQKVYSVNFLESIIGIQEASKESSIDIIADWCNNLPPSKDVPNIVTIKENHIETIGQIVEKYDNLRIDLTTETFVGKISALESEPEIDNRKFIKVKMVTIGSNNKIMNIHSYLDYNEYFTLVEKAFSQGLNVKINGIFNSNDKNKEIHDASFSLLD